MDRVNACQIDLLFCALRASTRDAQRSRKIERHPRRACAPGLGRLFMDREASSNSSRSTPIAVGGHSLKSMRAQRAACKTSNDGMDPLRLLSLNQPKIRGADMHDTYINFAERSHRAVRRGAFGASLSIGSNLPQRLGDDLRRFAQRPRRPARRDRPVFTRWFGHGHRTGSRYPSQSI